MHYRLENTDLVVTCDSLGGQLTSITDKAGLEYLWQGDAQYWSGQAPILFPICGSLRNNEALNQYGERITMPRHGLVRRLEFTCERQTQEEVLFSISADENTRRAYPYDFRLSVQYRLQGREVIVQYTVTNHSHRTMPFFIGGHPGFRCPLEEGLDFSDYQILFAEKEETALARPVAGGLLDRQNRLVLDFDGQILPLRHELFANDALCFDRVRSKQVRLASPKGEHGITLHYDDFPSLLIWSSANEGPFVALEPMYGLSTYTDEGDLFEHKDNVQLLPAGETASYSYRMRCD